MNERRYDGLIVKSELLAGRFAHPMGRPWRLPNDLNDRALAIR
jgi:hypothetical protein